MKAELLVTNISELATPIGANLKKGAAMHKDFLVEKDAAVAMQHGKIIWLGKTKDWQGQAEVLLDAENQAVLPGLVDPHTHAVWAGDRLQDFEMRIAGASYEEILRNGGGIRNTIAKTAAATTEELVGLALPRITALLNSGATSIEIKSGYGFEATQEIKMLQAIKILQPKTQAQLQATLLIHVPPKLSFEREAYLEMVCEELIPNVANQKLASSVDVFCEQEAFSVEECKQIFLTAHHHNLKIKLHADQFHSIGGTELAVAMKALSVDHLEASGPTQIAALAGSNSVATILPGVSLHLGLPVAPARQLITAGAAVALGTDLNPGSSPVFSSQLVMALATRMCKLTLEEALCAATANAAHALGLGHTHGRLEIGCAADFILLKTKDWREAAYTLGANPVAQTFVAGRPATERQNP